MSTVSGRILGIHEEARRRLSIKTQGEEVEFIEANPFIRNSWVGEGIELYTPEEASTIKHSGETARRWHSFMFEHGSLNSLFYTGNSNLEMIVKATDGYFYAATKNDTVFPAPN